MQVEEDTDVPACLPTPEFLSAEELVSLRKPAEETPQPVIGEKFYTRDDSRLEENTLKSALEGYKETLEKKRAGRICDLIEAVWDPELNVVTTSKLKGKFTQHMGRLVNGKHILAPEEAVFLLENNYIEIMNGETPMSTEEAFSTILKGNLAHEKYQTYSHLSKLGYVVVIHQTEPFIAEREKEMHLDKYDWKRKRLVKEPAEGEPEKKRLTFTGALSEESEIKTTSDASKENSATVSESETSLVCSATSMEETDITETSEQEKNGKNMHSVVEEQNGNGAMIHKVTEDIQSDLDKINNTSVNNSEFEANLETKGSEVSKEINSAYGYKSVAENENVVQTEENTKSNGVDSQNLNESTENDKLQSNHPLKNVENQDFLDSNSQSSKFVDVMDVDTDAETSCTTSEVSRDNFSAFNSNVNATSQDSCISVNNDDNTEGGASVDSMSCSSEDEEEEVLNMGAGSAGKPLREDDDDVTLLEVTKKEIKPLAVIDLLSDDDESEDADIVVDDDITVIEEYSSPSTGRPTSSKEINSKKMNCYKKEEGNGVVSSSKLIPPLTVPFPDLFKKRVVCVPRPPLHLLPNHVKPAKEAYVLNLKPKNSDQPPMGSRVWNSYRDMQDYQQQRRQNRHQNNVPRGQPYSGFQPWRDRNTRNHERFHRPGFGPDHRDSPDVTSNSRSLVGPPPVDFNRNIFSVNSFQNNGPLPNPTTMNCEVTIKEDNSESMVSSSSQSSHSNNFSLSSGMPNNPLINPLLPSSNFMAGIQRNPFSSMGNVSNNLMAELQRTCFTVATNMLSSMLNRNPPCSNPALSMFPPLLNATGPFNPNVSNGFSNSFNPPATNEYYSMPQQNFGDQQRRFHRGRPFPCRYRNIGNKRSWSDVRSAVCPSSSDSDIEEMPISPREILWENKEICPLVKPGVHYPLGNVFKFLQITQKATVTNKYGYSEKLLPNVSRLEIFFDVYTPGFTYKKTSPQIPRYRIVVVSSVDLSSHYTDIAILQRKWNDGSTLLIAVNDYGDISFQSFNSISLPLLTPHED